MIRLATGVVLLAAIATLAWFASNALLALVAAVVALLAWHEYGRLSRALGAPVAPAAGGALMLAALLAAAWHPGALVIVAGSGIVAAGALAVGRGEPVRDLLGSVASTVFGALYLGVALGTIIGVHRMAGREAALLLIVTVVASDAGQYYAGRTFGKRPLAPYISPKKTVEGAMGGLVAGSVCLALLGTWWLPQLQVVLRVLLGGAVVLLGITGDLFESLLKRSAGVKDSSTLLPGHGGVLDRIDALLFAAPVYYAVVTSTLRATE